MGDVAPGRAGRRQLRRDQFVQWDSLGLHRHQGHAQRQPAGRDQGSAGEDARTGRAIAAQPQVSIAYDATRFIQASIDEVVKTLGEAVLIVIVVVFLFLGAFRSVLIPVVTIPLSMIGVLFFMQAMGYSINLLTLLAMVLAIGLVVDDAIVVVENIHRHIEEEQAALRGCPGGRAGDRRTGGQHDPSPSPRSTRRSASSPASPAPCSRSSPSPWPAR
ncbi:efflux RND transporter permease subunit [Pseudomonas aeruginosa]